MLDSVTFISVLTAHFGLDEGTALDDRLQEDLGFDSLMLLECVELLESAADHPIADECIESLTTVRDLFGLYSQYRTTGR